MSYTSDSQRSVAGLPAVMFMTSLATLVQSYVAIKVILVILFLVISLVTAIYQRRTVVYPRLVAFYLAICVAGITWSIVGLAHGNASLGIFDAFRLYVAWSLAFLILFSLLRSEPSLHSIHMSMVVAGILISLMNLFGVADQILGWWLIPDDVRKELELYIGVHEGYIQITSQNIGALFLIVPYLMSLQFRSDAGKTNSLLTKVSLVLCLLLVAVSGRRALWLVVALTPCMVLLFSYVTKNHDLIRPGARRILLAYSVTVALVLGMALGAASVLPASILESGSVQHLMDAFSAEDERSRQKEYLLAGFADSPVYGSGFGAYAGYLRNDERPWTYELTYHQMLFNVGILGMAFLAALISLYLLRVVKILRRYSDKSAIPFGLLIAFCSLLLGTYSNPYLRSFDYLFFVGLLPYLSTFQLGFDQSSPLERSSVSSRRRSRSALPRRLNPNPSGSGSYQLI